MKGLSEHMTTKQIADIGGGICVGLPFFIVFSIIMLHNFQTGNDTFKEEEKIAKDSPIAFFYGLLVILGLIAAVMFPAIMVEKEKKECVSTGLHSETIVALCSGILAILCAMLRTFYVTSGDWANLLIIFGFFFVFMSGIILLAARNKFGCESSSSSESDESGNEIAA